MSLSLRLLTIIIALLFLGFIIRLVMRKRMSEKDSLVWIGAGIVLLIVSIIPQIPDAIAGYLGLTYSAAIYFYASIVFVLFVLCYHTTRVSDLTEKNKKLAQKFGIMENKIKELEDDKKPKTRKKKT